jgi:carbon monoxide dehydrogenase subunit G
MTGTGPQLRRIRRSNTMELKGESLIAAPRESVWVALNDPDVLARCIDGVETLTRVGDDRFEGKMNAKVGPVRATFTGGVNLTELDPPTRYVIVGEGKGGVAGFAKGSAEVVLTDVQTGTLLRYTVNSSVGGKLAQLGARLIEGTAKAYAETFFARFKAEVEGPPAPATGDVDSGEALGEAATAGVADAGKAGLSPLVWGALLVMIVVALLIWQLS